MYTIRYVCRECGYRWSRDFPPARPLEVCFKVDGTLIEVPVGPCCVEEGE